MKIALLTGGLSGERSVSIASAKNIAEVLDFAEVSTYTLPEDLEMFLSEYKQFDLAVPIIHGKGGEDGSVQGLLQELGIPYLFSDIEAHAIAIDKRRTKQIAALVGIKVSPEIQGSALHFPLFAKPRYGGSSVSSGICNNSGDLNNLRQQTNEEFILEVPVKGREFTAGVIEYNEETIALPVIEIITPEETFFDFEHKYNPDNLAREICPANIPTELSLQLQNMALKIHKELGVRHISRSDFIVGQDNEPVFLEINTIPGMTNTSLIPKMLTAAGVEIKTLFKGWCEEIKKGSG
jgi:D-alanine-D-alanine ligase